MKTNTISFSILGALVLAALLVVGILEIQHAYAQVDATSSGAVVTSSDLTPPVDAATSTVSNTSAGTTVQDSAQSAAATSGLVEVQLLCSQSYRGPLYDTPSGHVEYASSLDATGASTTTSTVANVIG
jgi:hypothetical protein